MADKKEKATPAASTSGKTKKKPVLLTNAAAVAAYGTKGKIFATAREAIKLAAQNKYAGLEKAADLVTKTKADGTKSWNPATAAFDRITRHEERSFISKKDGKVHQLGKGILWTISEDSEQYKKLAELGPKAFAEGKSGNYGASTKAFLNVFFSLAGTGGGGARGSKGANFSTFTW